MKILSTMILILCLSLGLWACGEEEDSDTAGSEVNAGTDASAGGTDASAGGTDASAGGTAASAGGTADAGGSDGSATWNSPCMSNDDCGTDANFCVKNPQDPPDQPGYCSIECSVSSECDGSELGWTCNVVGSCDSPLATWCGPESEIEAGMGVLVACN